jgi:glycosyltransferase involved in cell wall biosynthesis
LRLLGLYHALGANIETHYVGSYDWPGPQYRRKMLSPTLEELLVPLSADHFAAADKRKRETGGRVVIDSTFPEFAHLSPDYVNAARAAAATADVVIFSHPWIFPLVRGDIDPTQQLIVYDSHNVEGLLRMALLDDGGGPGTAIVRQVVKLERELCLHAHLVLACSHDDRVSFHRLYGVPFERMRVFANGTFTERIVPPTAVQKSAARAKLNLGAAPVVFFIGSNYAPNAEAAVFIARRLAPALPSALFVVAGGVAESVGDAPKPFNLRLPGVIYEDARLTWLHAADIAINPMFSGSGTNIKMLDYMAAGLPIITTPMGARGLDTCGEAFALAEGGAFAGQIEMFLRTPDEATTFGETARREVERKFSWELLSPRLGTLIRGWHENRKARPFFSVILRLAVDSDAKPVFSALANQTFPDMEIVTVGARHSNESAARHEKVRSVISPADDLLVAHNTGADVACGRALAFLESDCIPETNWLEAAHEAFHRTGAVVLEGHVRDAEPGYFSPENLFFQADTFHALGGFRDPIGDRDWVWLAQSFGAVMSVDATVSARKRPRSPTYFTPRGENVAWISSWNVPCGIAEYSRSLLSAMTKAEPGLAIRILCDSRHVPKRHVAKKAMPCWTAGAAKIDLLLQTLKQQRPTHLVIQHQPGLLPWPALCTLLSRERFPETQFLLTLHNTREIVDLPPHLKARVISALESVDVLLVHTMADHGRLRELGLSKAATVFPHGGSVPGGRQHTRNLERESPAIIGCFGFFFAHKRIHLLIEAAARLQKEWPNLRLRLVNAEFPRQDSHLEVARCRALARSLGLYDRIEWFTEFVEEPRAMALLSETDLIALPYADTPESASGALRLALASGAPVAVSRAAIFDEAEGAIARLETSSVADLASSLDGILRDAGVRSDLERSAVDWLYCRRWEKMAARVLEFLHQTAFGTAGLETRSEDRHRMPTRLSALTESPAEFRRHWA